LPLVKLETRYDYPDGRAGIDETLPVDACLHTLMGASKLAPRAAAQVRELARI
jgi:hypothetical protein